MFEFFDYMPEQASSWAAEVDWMNNWITDVSTICTVAITAVMLYFAWRYRSGKNPKPTSDIDHSQNLEIVWTVVPTIVCIYCFYIGFDLYKEMRTPPANSLEVAVQGYKWGWNFTYENGKTSSSDLVVPIGEPVKLVMKSNDVLHSFFIPSMRVKEDLRGDRYSYLWFTPTKLSAKEPTSPNEKRVDKGFPIFCAEYCGLNHSGMRARLKVVSRQEYDDFLNERGAVELTPMELGQKVYTERACNTCHSLDGSKLVGPSFKNLFGSKREFTSGDALVADENYLRESILNSQAKIVSGYAAVMPAFEGQLNESEIDALITFIKAQGTGK